MIELFFWRRLLDRLYATRHLLPGFCTDTYCDPQIPLYMQVPRHWNNAPILANARTIHKLKLDELHRGQIVTISARAFHVLAFITTGNIFYTPDLPIKVVLCYSNPIKSKACVPLNLRH